MKKQPDMIAQVGEMLKRLNTGDWCTAKFDTAVSDNELDPEISVVTDATIVLASAVLAVAAELRAINNSLTQLVEDNVLIVSEALSPADGDGGQ